MKKLNEFLRHNPKYRALQKPLKAARICEVAREYSKGRFEVISFRAGLLTVGVSSSAEAANLQAESQKIIDEINQKIGENSVERLRFKISNYSNF